MTTTTEHGASTRRVLDPDALAALEDERDFLLRSLADLEREHEAGDVDHTDYVALNDDYTARAAAVLRSIEQRRTAIADAAPAPSAGRRLAWVAGIVVLAVLAGFLIARASGTRRAGDTATGDPLRDTRQLLSDAQQAAVAGEYPKSIALYTKALDKQPGNVEALTYRGWSRFRDGDASMAGVDLDAAIDLDAKYPDARVFRASVFVAGKRYDDAAAQLAAFDRLDTPPLMAQIITSQRLRERVALGRVEPKLLIVNPPPYASVGLTGDDVFLAAQQLDFDTRVQDEIALYDQLLSADSKNVRALTYRAWVLARSGVQLQQPPLVNAAIRLFDDAVALDPRYPDARVFRAFTYQFGSTRSAEAKAELAVFDALADKPAALVALIDANNLRRAIDTSLAAK